MEKDEEKTVKSEELGGNVDKPEEKVPMEKTKDRHSKILITNISPGTTDEVLQCHCQQCCDCISAEVHTDNTGSAVFKSKEDALIATTTLNGSILQGSVLQVDYQDDGVDKFDEKKDRSRSLTPIIRRRRPVDLRPPIQRMTGFNIYKTYTSVDATHRSSTHSPHTHHPASPRVAPLYRAGQWNKHTPVIGK